MYFDLHKDKCLIAASSLVWCALSALSATAFTIAERGKVAECDIVLATDATLANRTAARELVDGVKMLTGVELAVKTASDASALRHHVFLRNDPAASESSFTLKVSDGSLVVSGDDRGVCYGVFELLERFGGVEWFTAEVADFPKRDRFEVPDGLFETQKPAIPIRDTSWYCGVKSAAIAAHLRLNGAHVRGCKMEPYGDVAIKWVHGLHHCHTFKNLLPVKEYGKAHPEYYAIQPDGRRNLDDKAGPNPCLTNPDVKRIVKEKVLAGIRANPSIRYFGVSQNDNRLWCRCPACDAINKREETDAGTLIEFVNEIAREAAKVRSDAVIATLAYHMTRQPPKTLKVEPNVMIELCTTECDFSAPLKGNPNEDTQRFVAALEKWHSLVSSIYIYDYMMNYRLAGHAMPNIAAFNENVKLYRENGAYNLYASGSGPAGWFAELKNYIEAKSMWNPDRDINPFIDRFMAAYYGPAAKHARAVLDIFEKYPRDRAKYPMPYYDDILSPAFPEELFEKAATIWKEASKVALAEPYASRVADEARKTDFTRVSRYVSRYISRDGKIRPDSDAAYREEMKAAAERLIAYETANPSVFVGWHWARYYQSKAYTLLGRTPPGKDPKKFGEL